MEAESHTAEPLKRPEPPGPGTRLGDRYELRQVIGRGGRGVVYRADDPVLGREVAVKLVPGGPEYAGVEARFQREAHVIARMDHPNIVPIYDFSRHGDTLFYVMPLLSGGSLRKRLSAGELSLGEAVEIGAQVASALDYSHAQGIVHRDVKPENILYSKEAGAVRVRVTDFGLAHDRSARRLTETNQLPGTLAYLSPEQVSGSDIDGRADLYALGVVLYECLVGAPPFEGAPFSVLYRIVHEPADPVSRHCEDLDPDLAALVDRCLAKDRQRRPARGREVALMLGAVHERLDARARERTLEPATRHATLQETPLVGRDAEAGALHQHLDLALGGECHLALVSGEAGTGKSRLLQELEGWALVRGVRVLRGHFSADDRTFPYQGLCELIQDYFRLRRARRVSSSSQSNTWMPRPSDSSSDSGGGEKPLDLDLSDLAPDLVALFPQLSEVPELREAAAEGAPAGTAGDTGPTRVFELIARTLARLGDGGPLVLLLESLHHGEMAVEALRYLVPRLAATPTLVVATYRPAEVGRGHPLADLVRQFGDDPRFVRIELDNLDREAFSGLIRRLVGSDALSDSAVDRLFDATEGNPLFACELVASLRESGELSRDPSGLWRLSTDVGALTHGLPTTLQQAAEARLARLEAGERALLGVAAVLGRSFDVDDLKAVLAGLHDGSETDFDRTIDHLVSLALLEEDAASRGDRVRFTSGAVRELLYRELSRRRRRSLHLACARQLRRRHRGPSARVLPELVHHYSRADRAAETVRFATELAHRSLDAYSPDDALQAARTGLEWVDDEAVADAALTEAELLSVCARAQYQLGDLEGCLRRGEQACGLFADHGEIGRAAEVAAMVARAAWQGRRMDEARAWVDRGIDLARSADAPAILRRVLALGGTLANLRGDSVYASRYLEEAEALAAAEEPSEPVVPTGGTLRVAMTYPVGRLVPGLLETDEEAEVATNVFETLLVAEDEGRLRPGLCREWRSSPDGRVFRLHLDPEARFSDGTAVTADLVKASLQQSARAGWGSLAPGFFDVIEGMVGADGPVEDAAGLQVVDPLTLEVTLSEQLPIFPVLLSDPRTAVAKRDGASGWLGTGPFVLDAEAGDGEVVLRRNERYWRRRGARLERLVFRTGLRSPEIAAALRAGEVDLGRDLVPEDLDDLLRRPHWRAGLVETTRKNVYFVLLNPAGPATRHAGVRRAVTGLVWPQDLVWRTLGRFAHPAVSLIPPGVLGHDPGRRHERLQRTRARILLEGADLPFPLRLRTAVHPVLQDRYAALLDMVFGEWRSLGIEVQVVTPDMDAFLATYRDSAAFDLMLGRWNADYDDPDNFTYNILHSRAGLLRAWVPGAASPDGGATGDDSWSECDELMERARREADPAMRVALYRRFEDAVYRRHVLLPLFHDVDYRIAAPRVRGLSLGTTYPNVSYAGLGVSDDADEELQRDSDRSGRAGGLQVSASGVVETLDPAAVTTFQALEVVGNVFETLTRLDRSARIVPWLASTLEAQDGGRRYLFRLRSGLRFQDGRPCTSRDVRHSFERLLRVGAPESHFVLRPVRGAAALAAGDADRLEGVELLSSHELTVHLEEPLAFFPALLAHPLAAIVPEGTAQLAGSWRDGAAGTGPFRIVRFEPGTRIELERNPYYWRRHLPKTERLTFQLGLTPDEVASEFEAGRLSLASDLLPEDVGLLRQRRPSPHYREHPRLSTYFLLLDNRRGVFADPEMRRAMARAVDVDSLVASTLGARANRAHGLLPPGMLGYDSRRKAPEADRAAAERLRGLRLEVRPHSAYLGALAPFWRQWCDEMTRLGVELAYAGEAIDRAGVDSGAYAATDVVAFRWIADYPDADAFALALEYCARHKLLDLAPYPSIEHLARQGRRETDPALRHATYRKLEDELARECLLVPLFHEQAYRLAQPEVRGLRLGMTFPEVSYEELYFT